MKLSLLPPPRPGELETLRIHELVRDYPELLPSLLREGRSLQSTGAECLGVNTVGVEGAKELLAVVAWRK
jgi:hypothetical protein